MDLSRLSQVKLKLLETCYYGILYADENKIAKVQNQHYSTDDWLEEECTPNYPSITIKSSGISTDLYINNKECIDMSLEP